MVMFSELRNIQNNKQYLALKKQINALGPKLFFFLILYIILVENYSGVVVQSLSHVPFSTATPWTAAHRSPCPSSPGACSNSRQVGDAI